MKNIFIATLGSSEIQVYKPDLEKHPDFVFENDTNQRVTYFYPANKPDLKVHLKPNRSFADYFLLANPREDGKLVSDNFADFEAVLEYPLFKPVLNYIQSDEAVTLDEILLIYTDQTEGHKLGVVSSHNYKNDTALFAEIIQKAFSSATRKFNIFPVLRDVTNIDALYTYYDIELHKILDASKDQVQQIYLLPQGGIDQINTALTLKLIEHFPGKVTQLQNAEYHRVISLKFPQRFLTNLNRQRVLNLLETYQFGQITADLAPNNSAIYNFATYADKRLCLLHNSQLVQEAKNLKKTYSDSFQSHWILNNQDISAEMLKDLYLVAKTALVQKKYDIFLLKMFVLSENIIELELQKTSFGGLQQFRNKRKLLDQKVDSISGLRAELNQNGTHTNQPNRRLLKETFFYLVDQGMVAFKKDINLLKTIIDNLEVLNGIRNKVAHKLYPATIAEIDDLIQAANTSLLNLAELTRRCDKYFEINDMGIYTEIAEKIRSFLNTK